MTSTGIIKVLPDPPQKNRQLSVIASVGFHVLMFAGLTLFPATLNKQNGNESVGLITLSPQEQSRLPNLKPSTPAAPGSSSVLPPPALSQGALPPLDSYDFDTVPPPPSSFVVPLPVVPPPDRYGFSPESAPPPDVQPPTSSPSKPAPSQPSPPDDIPLDPPKLNPMPPYVPNLPGDQSLAAPSPEVSPGPIPEVSPTPSDPTAPTTPGIGGREQEAVNQLGRWISLASSTIDPDNIGPLDLKKTIPEFYPPQACKNKLEGQTAVAVIVTPDGKLYIPSSTAGEGTIQNNPQIIGLGGGEVLDQAAVDAVKALEFKSTGKYRLLKYDFNFKYSEAACQAVTPGKTPTDGKATPSGTPTKPTGPSGSPSPVGPSPAPAGAKETGPSPEVSPTDAPSQPATPTPSTPEAQDTPSPEVTASPTPEASPTPKESTPEPSPSKPLWNSPR
jgi:outer membrane biosynthesis protein TonB